MIDMRIIQKFRKKRELPYLEEKSGHSVLEQVEQSLSLHSVYSRERKNGAGPHFDRHLTGPSGKV